MNSYKILSAFQVEVLYTQKDSNGGRTRKDDFIDGVL